MRCWMYSCGDSVGFRLATHVHPLAKPIFHIFANRFVVSKGLRARGYRKDKELRNANVLHEKRTTFKGLCII